MQFTYDIHWLPYKTSTYDVICMAAAFDAV